ncbi:MAG: response regulator [Promethearchaeota archaeon]
MPKILIIEDSKFIREYLEEFFEFENYDVIGAAESVVDGVKIYMENKPDIVIMDMVLPGKSGMEGIKEILEIDKEANIIVCSALGQEVLKMKVVKAGAKDYIVKPFKEKEILRKIKNILLESKMTPL